MPFSDFCVTFLRAAWLSCMCGFFFNIVNKIPHIYRHFLFKIRSQYYTRFFLFWLCTEVQKKSTFVPFIPDVTCVASPKKKGFSFFFFLYLFSPFWPHVHPICPIANAAFFLKQGLTSREIGNTRTIVIIMSLNEYSRKQPLTSKNYTHLFFLSLSLSLVRTTNYKPGDH